MTWNIRFKWNNSEMKITTQTVDNAPQMTHTHTHKVIHTNLQLKSIERLTLTLWSKCVHICTVTYSFNWRIKTMPKWFFVYLFSAYKSETKSTTHCEQCENINIQARKRRVQSSGNIRYSHSFNNSCLILFFFFRQNTIVVILHAFCGRNEPISMKSRKMV